MRGFTNLKNRNCCTVSKLVRKLVRKERGDLANGNCRRSHPGKKKKADRFKNSDWTSDRASRSRCGRNGNFRMGFIVYA